MTGENRYYRRSKVSQAKFRQLLGLFAMDLTATDAAAPCHLSVRSTNAIYQRIRVRFAQDYARRSPFVGEFVKPMSPTSGPRRVRGKRGRGAASKTIVFSLCSSAAAVFTPRSSLMLARPRSKRSFAVRSIPTASFTPLAGAAMTVW
jgi:hypothetical protein